MPKPGRQGGKPAKKLKTVPNISQRAAGTNLTSTAKSRASILPTQYVTPPTREVEPVQTPQAPLNLVPQPSTTSNHVRNFPPPLNLFAESTVNPVQANGPSSSHQVHSTSTTPIASATPNERIPESPLQHSQAPSHPSSQGHNFEEEDEEEINIPALQEETRRAIDALLSVPNRHQFVPLLSPLEDTPDSTWFDRDVKQRIVRGITRIFTASFNEPYYNWSSVPQEKAERWFLEFAKTYTWDPLITGTVQGFFYSICQKRLKNMVSNARRSGERPKWINETLWNRMLAHWNTDEQVQRSDTYSTCRKSDRGGLGAHRHVTGPKSYRQIQREMVCLLQSFHKYSVTYGFY